MSGPDCLIFHKGRRIAAFSSAGQRCTNQHNQSFLTTGRMTETVKPTFLIRVRTVLFYTLSATLALPFLMLLPGIVLPVSLTLGVTGFYLRLQLFLLRVVCGINYEVLGRENLPKGPCLIASQHESSWETLYFQVILGRPVMFAKKEVFGYPIIGLLSRRLGHIPIDRKGSADSMRESFAAGREAAMKGRKLLIFPTGTRRQGLDQRVVVQSGVGVLYQLVGQPVVPVLVNSGASWPASSLLKYPGKITVRILPQIPEGLGRRVFLDRIGEELNRVA